MKALAMLGALLAPLGGFLMLAGQSLGYSRGSANNIVRLSASATGRCTAVGAHSSARLVSSAPAPRAVVRSPVAPAVQQPVPEPKTVPDRPLTSLPAETRTASTSSTVLSTGSLPLSSNLVASRYTGAGRAGVSRYGGGVGRSGGHGYSGGRGRGYRGGLFRRR